MKSLQFETGYKEYALNDDQSNTIRICLTDANLPQRIRKAQERIETIAAQYGNQQLTEAAAAAADRAVREIVNDTFGSDICTPAFGSVNCLSVTVNGKMIVTNFVEALFTAVGEDIKAASQQAQQAIRTQAAAYLKK